MKSKLFILLILLLTSLFVFTACSPEGGEQVQRTEKKSTQQEKLGQEDLEEEIQSIEEEYAAESLEKERSLKNNYSAVSPFTGLPISQNYYKRAVAVSIENAPAARPQSGLGEAAIVYEFMLEGGITRFLAIYWPEVPGKIGPIRSARPALIKTAQSYDALFLHAGASPDGFELLADDSVLHLDQIYQSQYFWRSSKRRAPHNLYSGEEPLKNYLNNLSEKEYPEQFNFLTASVVSDFKKAENISIDYWGSYKVLYEYNSLENNYLRFLNSKDNPHLLENGEQLKAKNIIVQHVRTSTKDSQGRQDIDLESGGKMQLFRDGLVIEGSWKNNRGDITYFNAAGKQIKLNPGQTWIEVVPNGTEITY
ncbi:DUF3048 family protein [Halanaerobium saccharolyticum]|uniref:DUF3048 family protein n=1 Tax=Halanaerobium saccharolyticum TaxID=43595 RepID=A0A4R6LK32_9FIRM|nr:DUF3048 domain-containing protein [Halanaerobium saccharolyticum]TDO84479.1 DUF3048 family protein [Halanaerobium saccharolyticum]